MNTASGNILPQCVVLGQVVSKYYTNDKCIVNQKLRETMQRRSRVVMEAVIELKLVWNPLFHYQTENILDEERLGIYVGTYLHMQQHSIPRQQYLLLNCAVLSYLAILDIEIHPSFVFVLKIIQCEIFSGKSYENGKKYCKMLLLLNKYSSSTIL